MNCLQRGALLGNSLHTTQPAPGTPLLGPSLMEQSACPVTRRCLSMGKASHFPSHAKDRHHTSQPVSNSSYWKGKIKRLLPVPVSQKLDSPL